ncbi:MAG: hypothetical protein EA357_10660 [Micavibrio sp.]|nr:MAG: hypothetical protein EA357_10660 [Micavibrio sp.]
MLKKLLKFIAGRIRERSTWLGLVSLAAALGLALSPEQKEAIVSAGMALAGLIAALTKDTDEET